jgi:nucleoside diphosphate kinase
MKHLYQYIKEQENEIKAFTIIKPGFVKYKEEIHNYIKDKGFIMNDETNPMKLTDLQAKELYKPHKDKDFYNDLCKYMVSDECCAATWTYDNNKNPGVNTINLMKDIKDHFREKYGKDEMKNCMHSSDSLDNVKRESKIVFNK